MLTPPLTPRRPTHPEQVNAGPLPVTSELPITQDVCVQGTSAPWQQPADIEYAVNAAVDQASAGGCQDGSIKTYTVGGLRGAAGLQRGQADPRAHSPWASTAA